MLKFVNYLFFIAIYKEAKFIEYRKDHYKRIYIIKRIHGEGIC